MGDAAPNSWFSAVADATDPDALDHEVTLLRAVLGQCPRCIALVAPDGRLVGHNAAFASLFDRAPNVGTSAFDLFDAEDRAAFDEVLRSAARDDGAAAMFRGRTVSGRIVEFFAATLPAPDGNPIGVVLAGEDATNAAREERERATMARTVSATNERRAFDLAQAMLAHDVANAMTSLRLAFDELVLSCATHEALTKEVTDGFDHLQRILHAARRRAARDRPPASTELSTCIARAVTMMRATAAAAGVRVSADVASRVAVAMDGGELTQVLANLVSNAVHAVADAGKRGAVRISVKTDAAEETVTVRVEDEGVGIEPSRLQKVFEPYETSRADRGGTGLGLVIAKRLVENAGGYMRVVSKPDAGTTFAIELPRAASSPSPREPGRAPGRSDSIH